jgi:Ca2+-binding EF-hand superfamily protein
MKVLIVACAASLLVLGSAAIAQNPPKPVARGDYVKTLDTRFAAIDANHDGSLSAAELTAEQQREMEQAKGVITQQLSAKFKELDTNKNGSLSLQEFLAASPQIRPQNSAQQLLQQIDANKDGKVSLEEFRAPQVANFNRADTNHDGTVTPDEMKAAAGKK